jgi:glycosyltransferase involved in cell wall biosynthesis
MVEIFKSSNVFVLPSFVENSPNSLGEAMMIGTPSICSAVGGIMSIIDNEKNGLLFPSGDSAYLAFQLDRIFSDRNLALSISENGQKTASQRHSIEKVTLAYKNIYSRIINSK